jgi:putrescine transport system permease protein
MKQGHFLPAWLAPLKISGKTLITAIPYLWLLTLFLFPFLIVFKLSFAETRLAIPPYSGLAEYLADGHLRITLFLRNYLFLTEDPLYWKAYLSSVKIAVIATGITLCVAYPVAYAMAKAPPRYRSLLLMLVILPFWTSFLIRVYAWIGILKNEGFLNHFLLGLGVINQPLHILNTDTAVYIGMVYSYLPFMLLPLYANLEKMDLSLLEAAADLGCRPLQAFWKITVPLSLPGIKAGCLLMFIPAVGEFVIPSLLGGSETLMIGKTLWMEFFNNRDWPLASAAAVVLLLILVVPIMWFQKMQTGKA